MLLSLFQSHSVQLTFSGFDLFYKPFILAHLRYSSLPLPEGLTKAYLGNLNHQMPLLWRVYLIFQNWFPVRNCLKSPESWKHLNIGALNKRFSICPRQALTDVFATCSSCEAVTTNLRGFNKLVLPRPTSSYMLHSPFLTLPRSTGIICRIWYQSLWFAFNSKGKLDNIWSFVDNFNNFFL